MGLVGGEVKRDIYVERERGREGGKERERLTQPRRRRAAAPAAASPSRGGPALPEGVQFAYTAAPAAPAGSEETVQVGRGDIRIRPLSSLSLTRSHRSSLSLSLFHSSLLISLYRSFSLWISINYVSLSLTLTLPPSFFLSLSLVWRHHNGGGPGGATAGVGHGRCGRPQGHGMAGC